MFILFLGFSLTLITYGAFLQKTQSMANIKQLLFNATETKFSVFNNYLSGFFSSPDKIYIDINFKDIQLLNFARDAAISKGIITEEEQKVSVKANLTFNSSIYKVKISPTGENLDMIGDIDKRAYKVKVLQGKKIFGFSEFKLLPPISRHYITEWIGHALEINEGLIALRYFFIEATLNGKNLGVFAVEEHFEKELLENRQSREGIIFSAKSNEIKIFNEKKIMQDPNKKNQVRFLQSALQSIKNNELDISKIFDLKKFASQFAIIDLMYGYHAYGYNSFFYFNPISRLIEPITREYNSLRYSEGQPGTGNLMLNRYQNSESGWGFAHKLFKNKNFTSYYLSEIVKLSDAQYLDNFFKKIDSKLIQETNIIYRDNPFYKFPKEYMYERQAQIRKWLNKDLKIIVNFDTDEKKIHSFRIKNNSAFPVKILNFFSTSESFMMDKNIIIYPKEKKFFKIGINSKLNLNHLNFSYKIYGINNMTRKAIVVPKSFKTSLTLPKLWNNSFVSLINKNYIKVDKFNKNITFNNQKINITKNLFIPENYTVTGSPGLTLNLLNGASIYSKSAFYFIGSANNQINVTSSDSKGGGIIIIDSKRKSNFIHTNFKNLSSPNKGSSGITSSITFYKTDVSIKDCYFKNNNSEDFLNLIRSNYTITNTQFKLVKSDAIDSDFSTGVIRNISFNQIGNDALDFSGSESELFNIHINDVGDKAISVGEKSNVIGRGIIIENAEIGITSKDLSVVKMDNVKINNTRLGFAIFQKKKEYNASKAEITNLIMSNIENTHLVETNSNLTLNGRKIINKISNVSKMLYGKHFGKSSKKETLQF
ncbi:hypothetical protein OAM56_00860 [Alphaproteobacteria bacterium]|nr:hypothetical protein [Alphaproteobacteria bacterium]